MRRSYKNTLGLPLILQLPQPENLKVAYLRLLQHYLPLLHFVSYFLDLGVNKSSLLPRFLVLQKSQSLTLRRVRGQRRQVRRAVHGDKVWRWQLWQALSHRRLHSFELTVDRHDVQLRFHYPFLLRTDTLFLQSPWRLLWWPLPIVNQVVQVWERYLLLDSAPERALIWRLQRRHVLQVEKIDVIDATHRVDWLLGLNLQLRDSLHAFIDYVVPWIHV